MFTEADYLAASICDAVRHLNATVSRAMTAGLTVALRVTPGKPAWLSVNVTSRDASTNDTE